MNIIYTKNGRPLQRVGNQLWAASGSYLGMIQGIYIYDTAGRYAGTIDGDRVVYQLVDSARISIPSCAPPRLPIMAIDAIPAVTLGDEPRFSL